MHRLFYFMPRLSINQVYMDVAYAVSQLSYAERRKVGCVIVKDNQIVSFGYNGTPKGFDNACENVTLVKVENIDYSTNPDAVDTLEDDGFICKDGCCVKREISTKREVLHAESNAISKIAKSTMSSDGADLYTTTSPCFECSKLIVQAGIKTVYYTEEYRDTEGLQLLNKANIEVIRITKD